MLSYFFLKQRYVNYIKNNFYFDYFTKMLAKAIVYNVFIQLSFFFAEKYLIEYYTRYSFNYSAISFNKISLALNYRYTFIYVISVALNVLILLL